MSVTNEFNEITMRSLRQDINEVRRLALDLTEMVARIERNQREIKDDLQVMFKMEIIGFRTNMETSFDARFAALANAFDNRFDGLEQLIKETRNA